MSWILPEHPWPQQRQTLERWLELATDSLSEAAAEQVRADYMGRWSQALASGQTGPDALRAWGDPNEVNQQLRRVHLTQDEAAQTDQVPQLEASWPGLWAAVRQDAWGLGLLTLAGVLSSVMGTHTALTGGALTGGQTGTSNFWTANFWVGNFWVMAALLAPALTVLRWRLLSAPRTHTEAAWADALLRPFTLWALAIFLNGVSAFVAVPPVLAPTSLVDESGQPDWGRMVLLGFPIYLEWSRRRQTLTAARKRDAAGAA